MSDDDSSRAAGVRSGAGAESPAGLLAGRYRLGRTLGVGGAARVFRAHDVLLDRAVAVKLFDPWSAMSSAVRRSSEIRLLAGLSHPNLVTVFDAGTGSGPGGEARPFLVMELVDGTSLAERLRFGPLPPSEVAHLGAQVAAALSYVHGQPIVHRDIKPDNVLLAGRVVKLADFGIARLLDQARHTAADATVGTANYLSPEQVSGLEVGPASDIYSLGLVLIEALTGAVAYPGHGVAAAAARLPRPPAIPAGLRPAWADLLTRMTAREPTVRPTADQAATALGDLAAAALVTGAPTQVLARAQPVRAPSRPRRIRWWTLAATIAVVAIAVALAYALTSDGNGGPPSTASARTSSTRPPAPDSSKPPASHSRTDQSTNAAPPSPRPPTPAQAIRLLRAAIAHAVNSGNLDLAGANDLDHRLSDISTKHSAPDPNPDDLAHHVADLLKHIADLHEKGQLTPAGQQILSGPLHILTRLIPPQD